jgi:hypothetical protein
MTSLPDLATHANLTQCGLPGIHRIPYGLHACHFYQSRQELVDALVPYFAAGLRSKERCLWVTAPPLPAAEAAQALAAAWEGVGDAMDQGALRILDHDRWYADSARLKGSDVVKLWLEEEQRALAAGYAGLRITGNVTFLDQAGWRTFMDYERALSPAFYGSRIVALCTYSLEQCSAQQVVEVTRAHDCSFDRPDLSWQVLSERRD